MIEVLKLALEPLEELNETQSYWWQDVDEETVAKIDPAIIAIKQAIAELESQEPVGRFAKFTDGVWRPVTDYSAGVPLYAHPLQRTERNFCSRCGKRTADLTTIHTCTPPRGQA